MAAIQAVTRKKGQVEIITSDQAPRVGRSVMFNPHDGHTVAGAFDNGAVQLWDTRKPRSARCHFAAHHGYAPRRLASKARNVLATGGRDGQIKVGHKQAGFICESARRLLWTP